MKTAYFMTYGKKSIKLWPWALIGAMMLGIILSTMAFCGAKVADTKGIAPKPVALYIPEDDTTTQGIFHILGRFASIKDHLEFTYAEGPEDLPQDLNPVAEIYFPEDFYQKILDGRNEPPKVIIHGQDDLPTRIFSTLAKSGTHSLSRAQAAVYAALTYAKDLDRRDLLPQIQKELNEELISYFIARLDYFDQVSLNPYGQVSTANHFVATGLLFFVLMMAVFFQDLYRGPRAPFDQMMAVRGVSSHFKAFSQFFWTFLPTLLLSLGFYGGLRGLVPQLLPTGVNFANLLLLCLSVSLFHSLVYRLSREAEIGALAILLLSLVGLLLSGALLPRPYLPKVVQALSTYLPWTSWHRLLTGSLERGVLPLYLILGLSLVTHTLVSALERRQSP